MPFCYTYIPIVKKENENYPEYFDRLYSIFKNEILDKLFLNGKKIEVRKYPPEGLEKEEAFYHLTCVNYDKKSKYRQPDFHRSERLRLIKQIIDNVNKCPCEKKGCGTILLWKKDGRYHMFLQDENYLVVLEDRKNYYLLVTAFWVSNLKKEHYLKEYDMYQIDTIE